MLGKTSIKTYARSKIYENICQVKIRKDICNMKSQHQDETKSNCQRQIETRQLHHSVNIFLPNQVTPLAVLAKLVF